MNRIEKTILKLKEERKKGLVGYFMCGEFSQTTTLETLHKSVTSGLDFIELGFPFSDPTADGAIIQNSAQKALVNGTTIKDVFCIVKEFRMKNNTTPIILMGYFNIIFRYGLSNFAKECHNYGIDGLIVVDLPTEESSELEKELEMYNIFLIQVTSFLTNKKRFKEIEKHAKGFIYLVSSFGVTGQTKPMLERIQKYIHTIEPKLPIFAGFGISSAESAKDVGKLCDGVVIGSHFIRILNEHGITMLQETIKEISSGLYN